jgi:hypothetical protein
MKRSPTVSERIVTAGGMIVTAAWCVFALWVILSYRGATAASTWIPRLVMVLFAEAATAGVVLVVRACWRRALEQRMPAEYLSSRLIRRPGWQLAIVFWMFIDLPVFVIATVARRAGADEPTWPVLGIMLLASVIGCSFLALMVRVAWRRQAENSLESRSDM